MNSDLFTNNHGLRLIKEFEGAPRLTARLCEGNRYELGYGITFYPDGSPVKQGDTCTPERADEMFRHALGVFEDAVIDMVGDKVELNENQFSALVALCYNIGVENFRTSTVLRETKAGRIYDAAAAFGMWIFATNGAGHKQALRGLLRRRYAEALLYLGYDWTIACDIDAIALQRIPPETLPGRDTVRFKTPFSEVLAVAQKYPLEAMPSSWQDIASDVTALDLTPSMQAAPSDISPEAKAEAPEPVPQPTVPATSAQPDPASSVVESPDGEAGAAPVPRASPAPAPPISTKPPPKPVIIAPKSVDIRSIPYGEIDPEKGAKNMTDSQRAIGLVIVGIGSIIQIVTMRLGIATAIGAIAFDLSRDPAVIAIAATGVAVVIGWLTRKRGTKVMTQGMVNATQVMK